MALTLSQVKVYLRVDYNTEDSLITNLMQAATDQVKQTTGKTTYNDATIEENELFQTVVEMIVAHWYENRGMVSPAAVNNLPLSVESIIKHISLCGEFT